MKALVCLAEWAQVEIWELIESGELTGYWEVIILHLDIQSSAGYRAELRAYCGGYFLTGPEENGRQILGEL